jgi:hypothetical protein
MCEVQSRGPIKSNCFNNDALPSLSAAQIGSSILTA